MLIKKPILAINKHNLFTMMKRTLGGDRLGVGNKMQVEMHGYERSNHNIGYVFRNTQSPGTVVPIFVEPALPGTTFDIEFDLSIMTKPTNGPCFGGAKVEIDVFQAPIRLYQRILHNNQMKIGLNPELIKFPVIELLAPDYTPDAANYDLDNSQINASCIFKYLGISGVGLNTTGELDLTRKFNAIPKPYRDWETDRKSTRLNSSHSRASRMPSSA